MLSSGRAEQTTTDGVDARPACVALVPVVQRAEWTAGQPTSQPASTFVTQLLATAEQVPQTRGLRRATAADAGTAYRASQRQVLTQARIAGIRTRQII